VRFVGWSGGVERFSFSRSLSQVPLCLVKRFNLYVHTFASMHRMFGGWGGEKKDAVVVRGLTGWEETRLTFEGSQDRLDA
jgi:hypothetical protein